MKRTDFSVPRRMSKSAFVIIYVKELKQIALLLVLVIFQEIYYSDKQQFLNIIGLILFTMVAFFGLAAIMAFIQYYFKKYYVENGNLIFIHGIFHRETTSIPLYKVQSMRTKQGFIYRLLDMKGVSFDTLASKKIEIELILDEEDWKALLGQIKIQEQNLKANEQTLEEKALKEKVMENSFSATASTNPAISTKSESINITREYPTKNEYVKKLYFNNLNLIKGAFCQNHLKGLIIIFTILAILYDNISTVNSHAINYLINYMGSRTNDSSFILTVFIGLYLASMILWICKVFLRYSNMEVQIAEEQLFFESGLITRRSSRFSYDKVCTLYVKQNVLEKWFGFCTIMLKQAFNATNKNTDCDVKIYGSNSSAHFLNWWLGKNYISSEQIISAQSGYGLLGHIIKKDILISLSASIILYYFELFTWLFIPVIYIGISLIKGIFAVQRSKITLKEDYLEINTGKLANIWNYCKYTNIEVVRLVRTPFTPFFHRVHLFISTNGTSFKIRSLKEEEAEEIYELLLHNCRE